MIGQPLKTGLIFAHWHDDGMSKQVKNSVKIVFISWAFKTIFVSKIICILIPDLTSLKNSHF